MMKAAVCFYQVVGYGKKQVDDIKMLERINEYQTVIQQLKQELEVPISQITPLSQKFDVEAKVFARKNFWLSGNLRGS
jgi:hypothetical protein